MASPVDTPPDPFLDPPDMAESDQPSKDNSGVMSSADTSRPGSAGGRKREKKKVGFTGSKETATQGPGSSWIGARGSTLSPPSSGPPLASPEISGTTSPSHSRAGSGDFMLPTDDSRSHLPELSPQQTQEIHEAFNRTPIVAGPIRPRPAIRRLPLSQDANLGLDSVEAEGPDDDKLRAYRRARQLEAYERGKRLETDERVLSESNSRYNSPDRGASVRSHGQESTDIPLQDFAQKLDDTDSDSEYTSPKFDGHARYSTAEAHKLVRKHTVLDDAFRRGDATPPSGLRSGAITPTEEQDFMEDYKPRPDHYRAGILGTLLKLYSQHPYGGEHSRNASRTRGRHSRSSSTDLLGSYSAASTPQHSPPESGTVTPNGTHWYSRKPKSQSTTSLAQLIGTSASLGSPVVSGLGEQVSQRLKEQKEQREAHKHRPGLGKRTRSANAIAALNRLGRPRTDDEIRITIHVAETIMRQRYLMKLCKALMMYGAPTHRLEEYMNMSARVLEIQAQFLYIPGSMIMSFDDPSTHTTEVKLVRVNQGLDLGRLRDVHEVYKDVVHDRIGVEEATTRLKEVTVKKPKHSLWVLIPVYGLAAACVGPFAFEARLIDLPIAFILGCTLGILQLIVAPRSDLYANVFEIAATVITSFLARAFGSIPDGKGGRLFCFSALAQSSIALILPGYTVLCASLELQSRSIVAGSVRMVYAIIYSLFLGFGITIGTAIYGLIDSHATSATTCSDAIPEYWFFFFVPGFTMCLIIINKAHWRQSPVMLIIAFAGYVVNFFSSKRFAGNTQVSNTLGALVIGVLANLYSRIGARVENRVLDLWEDTLRHYWKGTKSRILQIRRKTIPTAKVMEEGASQESEQPFVRKTRRVGYGLAAAAMLPAIFVQVPSGLAVSGSLISGITSADQITGNATNGTSVVNNTTLISGTGGALNDVALNVGYSVIQVAIGITVGLFLSAVVVYPFGKKRSGLFSF